MAPKKEGGLVEGADSFVDGIPIEERPPEEVRRIGDTVIALDEVEVFNPAFDVTPANLVDALITERGVVRLA